MGREATRRETGYLQAGLDVYLMETHAGITKADALVHAIEAAVATAHRGFVQDARDDVMRRAEFLDTEDVDFSDDGVASLLWYAKSLDDTLPLEMRL